MRSLLLLFALVAAEPATWSHNGRDVGIDSIAGHVSSRDLGMRLDALAVAQLIGGRECDAMRMCTRIPGGIMCADSFTCYMRNTNKKEI